MPGSLFSRRCSKREKLLVTRNQIRSSLLEAKAKAVQPLLSNESHDFTQLLKYQIEQQLPCVQSFKSFVSFFQKTFLEASHQTEERNLHVTLWQRSLALHFTLRIYFSWQRGSNENANGLLREYFPKKTDLALIRDRDLFSVLFDINHPPRKCLGQRTPPLRRF